MNPFYLIIVFVCVSADTSNLDLVSDYNVTNCLKSDNDSKNKYFGVDIDGFPYCAPYTQDSTCTPEDDNSCEPGLICDGESKTCKVNKTSCFKYYTGVYGNECILELLWTPDCTEDGSWAPKQCKGGTGGRCFCYDSKGHRLFGSAFEEKSDDMTCACTKRKAELLDSSNENKRTYVGFHCDQIGNFEELQCDSGHCWCADPKTGEPTSVIVPEKTMKFLKCFTKLKGDQYLRKCESIAYAQEKIIHTMNRHGIVSPNIKSLSCEDDGSYGPYIQEGAIVYCVTSTNTKTSYFSEASSEVVLNCNCARDNDMYKELGKQFNLKCNSNGNYETFQKNDGAEKGFCVDKDGIKLVDGKVESDCKIFEDYL